MYSMTKAQLTALKEELDDDPESRGYASMSDWQAAADLNEERYDDGWKDVPAGEVAGFCELTVWNPSDEGSTFIYETLEVLRDSDEAGMARIVAAKLLRAISGGLKASVFEMSNPATRAAIMTMLDALVAAGMSPDNKNAILALAKRNRSRAEAIGLPRVTTDDVTYARHYLDEVP